MVKRPQGPHCLGLNPVLTDLRQVHISCLISETRKVLGPACPLERATSGDRVWGRGAKMQRWVWLKPVAEGRGCRIVDGGKEVPVALQEDTPRRRTGVGSTRQCGNGCGRRQMTGGRVHGSEPG